MGRYADIVLPLYQPLYTFAVDEGAELSEGDAVAVQFGPKALYTGIVWKIHNRRPDTARVKSVGRRLYDRPLLSAGQMRFWEWISEYYMCTLGEVMRFALPAMIKPKGGDEDLFEQDRFRPRTAVYVVAEREPSVDEMVRLSKRAPKQIELLGEVVSSGGKRRSECNPAAVAALLKKGFLRTEEREIGTEASENVPFEAALPPLTPAQRTALDKIAEGWRDKPTVLLHGVSGSGKTEIYMHLAARILAEGGDVLMLVPEIALTTRLVARIRSVFGERTVSYHSQLTARRRTETYLRLNRSQGGNFVVGARSALFLPLHNLRLVIVDEEHDSSYKQTEPPPRYHGRDAALMLARLHNARSLLGSATPSLESCTAVLTGKYGRAKLDEKFGGGEPSRIIISDTMRAVKRGERRSHFNKIVIDKIGERLERGEQVLLFQNRRGYSPYTACEQCGRTIRCPRCNVTLSLHQGGTTLVCHYCGHTEQRPRRCPACNNGNIIPMGFGTEKVEYEIAELFPSARVLRLDRDTATSESAYERIIGTFERGEADILVGTQIITKGLDFAKVTLTAVLNADNLLNAPDYRASERAFQTIMQFAGRGGRRDIRGEIVVQTSDPEHPVLQQVSRYDYEAMARSQLAERQAFFYPPYAHLTVVTMRHSDMALLHRAAADMAKALRDRFSNRVFGPNLPSVDRVRDQHIVEIVIKIESGASFSRARMLMREAAAEILRQAEYKSVTIMFNVDA